MQRGTPLGGPVQSALAQVPTDGFARELFPSGRIEGWPPSLSPQVLVKNLHRFRVFEIEFTIPPGAGFQKYRLADGYRQRFAVGSIQLGAFHGLLPLDNVSNQ